MNITELIAKLKQLMNEIGDVEVHVTNGGIPCVDCDEWGSVTLGEGSTIRRAMTASELIETLKEILDDEGNVEVSAWGGDITEVRGTMNEDHKLIILIKDEDDWKIVLNK